MSPTIPAVGRVMTGWFCVGIGVLNLLVESDGGLTAAYTAFHVALMLAGVLLLSRRRLIPSRAGSLLGAAVVAGGMALGLHPYPPVGTRFVVIDLIFWASAGLVLLSVIALVERRLPERRTPVDLTGRSGRAEPENVGGLP